MAKYLIDCFEARVVERYMARGKLNEARDIAHARTEVIAAGWIGLGDAVLELIEVPGEKPPWHCTIYPSILCSE